MMTPRFDDDPQPEDPIEFPGEFGGASQDDADLAFLALLIVIVLCAAVTFVALWLRKSL